MWDLLLACGLKTRRGRADASLIWVTFAVRGQPALGERMDGEGGGHVFSARALAQLQVDQRAARQRQ